MTIILNGAKLECSGRTLSEALIELGYAGATVATAVNGRFVPARDRAATILSDDDAIEIIAPMQGG